MEQNTTLQAPVDRHLTDASLWADAPVVEARKRRLPTFRTLLTVVVSLAVGGVAGALIMRQKTHARELVMSVNGAAIESDYFRHRMEMVQGPQVISQMLGEQLQLQYAQKLGLMPSEVTVAAKLKEKSDQPNWGNYLATTGQTPDDVKHAIQVQLAQQAILTKGVTVTDADAQNYYNVQSDPRNVAARYYMPPSVRIAVIVSATEADSRKALAQLQKSVPFDQVAKQFSRDPSSKNGGELPPILKGRTPSSRIPGVEALIFGMDAGQLVGPRSINKAWWLIRCLEKKPEVKQPFEKVKEECREQALLGKAVRERGMQVHNDFVKFQKESKINAFWPQYSGIGNVK